MAPPEGSGVVAAIALAGAAEEPMRSVERVRAVAGVGLEGDRYANRAGTFSETPGDGRHLTLVAAEALGELAAEGTVLDHLQTRRNLLTSGVDLDALIGREFSISGVRCAGRRECVPCSHLERLEPGSLKGLARRGGLRADILEGGTIAVGDAIDPLGPAG